MFGIRKKIDLQDVVKNSKRVESDTPIQEKEKPYAGQKRSRRVLVSFDEKLMPIIENKAKESAIPMATLCRMLIISHLKDEKFIPPKQLDELAYQIGKLGSNLNQIAHIANKDKSISKHEVQRTMSIFEDIQHMIQTKLI